MLMTAIAAVSPLEAGSKEKPKWLSMTKSNTQRLTN
jgi:hypothetical protein